MTGIDEATQALPEVRTVATAAPFHWLAAAGFATAFLGLVVAIPVIGHATWHAYRELVA